MTPDPTESNGQTASVDDQRLARHRSALLRGGAVGLVAVLGLLLVQLAATDTAVAAPRASAIVEIITVPSIPGAKFSFDGVTHKADKRGIVRLAIKKGSELHKLSVVDTKVKDGGRDLSFVRWWYTGNHDQDFGQKITDIRIHRNLRVMAAFRATQQLSYSFADAAGDVVDRRQVSRIELFGDNGQTVTGDGSGKIRVVGVRPVVSGGTILAKQVRYSVQRVDVAGSNVVQVNHQIFVPAHEPRVVVPLLLWTARFSTRDFLFGNPVGKGVRLTYPDKRTIVVPLDTTGKATMVNLARGQYTVRVDGPGYSFNRPVVLSRNQYIDLPVLTYLDLGVVGALGVAFAATLALLRSRTRRTRLRAAYNAL
jgi:hypothetical protein